MPNLLTRYTNGTFEDPDNTWDGSYFSGYGAAGRIVRSNDFAFEGIYSAKITTIARLSTATAGHAGPLSFIFPAGEQLPNEFRIRIRCSAGIPDDLLFAIIPSTEDLAILQMFKASDCKTEWKELKCNFLAGVYPLGPDTVTEVFLYLINNTDKLISFYGDFLLRFPQMDDISALCDIPEGEFIYIDFAEAEEKAMPVILDQQFDGRRLYHAESVFLLSDGTTVYEIEEPIKWDQILIQILFDESTFGFRFEFSDKDVLLEFDTAAGFDILKPLWKNNGTQAFASIKYGQRTDDVLEIFFEADLNFQSYIEGKYVCKMNCERVSFAQKFRTRFDMRTDLFRPKTLDGRDLNPMTLQSLFLHPRVLDHSAEMVYNTNVETSVSIVDPTVGTGFGTVPPFKSITQNIDNFTDPVPPDGNLLYAGYILKPGVSKRIIRIPACNLSFSFDVTDPAEGIAGFSIYVIKNITTAGGIGFPVTLGPGRIVHREDWGAIVTPATVEINVSLSGTLELEADDGLFVRAWIRQDVGAGTRVANFQWINIEPDFFNMFIREETLFPGSTVQTPFVFDAVNRQLEIILDSPNPLRSNFLGKIADGYPSDGCASHHFLFNGLMVRKFPVAPPFNMSAKDWVNGLGGIFCTGLSVERDDDDTEYMRFEELPYFFRDVLIMTMDTIIGYEKSAADEVTFNELEIKPKKFPQNNQADSLQDFHSGLSFDTPLTKIKNKFSKIIDFILSPYYLEYTRQNAYIVNPKGAYETDNDTFIISGLNGQSYPGVSIEYDEPTNTIIIDTVLAAVTGDIVNIADTTGSLFDVEITVKSAEIPYAYDKTILKPIIPIVASGLGTGNVTIVNSRYKARRTEGFSSIVGDISPESIYNAEHHFKRIFLRWAKYFQSGWDFFIAGPNNERIEFIEGKNNTGIETTLDPAFACKYGQGANQAYADDRPERVSTGAMQKPLFGKSDIKFEAPLTWTTLNFIRKCYEGRDPDGKNYGYFKILNPDNEYEKVFVRKIKFNPVTQMTKFETREKYNG